MAKALFEVECENAEIVRQAVDIEGDTSIDMKAEKNKLIFTIEAPSLRELMKVSYSIGNKIQLSIDTVETFGKK